MLQHFVATNLMHSFKVVAHGRVSVTGIITTLHGAVIHGALVVNLCVLLQVALVLKPIRRRRARRGRMKLSQQIQMTSITSSEEIHFVTTILKSNMCHQHHSFGESALCDILVLFQTLKR